MGEPQNFVPETSSTEMSRRFDWFVLSVVVLLSALVRAWKLSSLGLDHFDEGVYALSGFWSLHSFHGTALYPFQKFFSPPGYFGVVGLAYLLFGGASDVLAIAINVICGAATVALAGWAGRRWFGRGCGLAAAILVAFNNYHVAFSRSALTDTLFGFLFLFSLALIAIAMEKQQSSWGAVAGLAAGAAMNVKYHGWMPVALAFILVVTQSIAVWQDKPKVWRMLSIWVAMAAVAVGCFLPWVIYTQAHLGGYLVVERFHSQFLDFQWGDNFARQLEMQLYLEGWMSRLAPAFAFVVAFAATGRRAFSRWRVAALAGTTLVTSGIVLGGAGTCVALAIFGFRFARKRGGIFSKLITYSAAALFILVPCYTPYARLLLPWLIFVQILAATGIQHFLISEEPAGQTDRRLSWVLGASSLVALLYILSGFRAGPSPRTWDSKESVRDAVTQMSASLPPGSAVFVDQEPDVAFYFRRAGYVTFTINRLSENRVTQDPLTYSSSGPVYVVGGLYARQQPDWNPIPEEFLKRMTMVAQFQMQPGDVRLLDDFPPSEALDYRVHPDARYNLVLFRVVPLGK